MTGLLPGVGCERRRRIHRSKSKTHNCSSPLRNEEIDLKLGCIAREARERLDAKLGSHRKSDLRSEWVAQLQTEVFEGSGKRFNWKRMKWQSEEDEDCGICLETFRSGEAVLKLPCGHKFHSVCSLQWLLGHPHCPCCRRQIPILLSSFS